MNTLESPKTRCRFQSLLHCSVGLLVSLSLLVPAQSARSADSFSPDQSVLPAVAPAGAIHLLGDSGHEFVAMSGESIDWPYEEGVLTSTKKEQGVNHIVSKWLFRDADIHVEFKVDPRGEGNSGVYIHGHYEMQILNTHGKPDHRLSDHDEGALYGFNKPLKNAARPAGEWQVYDIRYIAPRRDEAGKITEEGSITAWLNGVLVQDKTRFGEPKSVYHPFRFGTTTYLKTLIPALQKEQVGPVFLQDHQSPAQFRNVWIVPLDDKARQVDAP